MPTFDSCSQCGRTLRDCVVCPQCRYLLCRWSCFERHAAKHAETQPAATPVQSLSAQFVKLGEALLKSSRLRDRQTNESQAMRWVNIAQPHNITVEEVGEATMMLRFNSNERIG
jgi:hypothetical protein